MAYHFWYMFKNIHHIQFPYFTNLCTFFCSADEAICYRITCTSTCNPATAVTRFIRFFLEFYRFEKRKLYQTDTNTKFFYIYIFFTLGRQGAYYWHKFPHHMKTTHTFYTRIKLYSLMGNLKKCMHMWCVLPYFIHSFSTNLTFSFPFHYTKCVVLKSVSVFFPMQQPSCVSVLCVGNLLGFHTILKLFFLQNKNQFYFIHVQIYAARKVTFRTYILFYFSSENNKKGKKKYTHACVWRNHEFCM